MPRHVPLVDDSLERFRATGDVGRMHFGKRYENRLTSLTPHT